MYLDVKPASGVWSSPCTYLVDKREITQAIRSSWRLIERTGLFSKVPQSLHDDLRSIGAEALWRAVLKHWNDPRFVSIAIMQIERRQIDWLRNHGDLVGSWRSRRKRAVVQLSEQLSDQLADVDRLTPRLLFEDLVREQQARATAAKRVDRTLTDRQRTVLWAAGLGLSAQKTGVLLGSSKESVKTLRTRILRNLGATNLTQAYAMAFRQGLLDDRQMYSNADLGGGLVW